MIDSDSFFIVSDEKIRSLIDEEKTRLGDSLEAIAITWYHDDPVYVLEVNFETFPAASVELAKYGKRYQLGQILASEVRAFERMYAAGNGLFVRFQNEYPELRQCLMCA